MINEPLVRHRAPALKRKTKFARLEVAKHGGYVALHAPANTMRGRYGGDRGAIKGFTPASRRRLIKLMASVDRRTGLPLFVTLTYPKEWPQDWHIWKGNLHAWVKRLERRYPGCCVVWKLEPQERGAPHFHLLVWGVAAISKKWLSRSWYEVVGSGDEKHLRAGTQVKKVRSFRGVMFYAAKYMTKNVEFENVGRFWGIYGREHLPVEVVNLVVDHWKDYIQLKRQLRRVNERRGLRARAGVYCGISTFMDYKEVCRLTAWQLGVGSASMLI